MYNDLLLCFNSNRRNHIRMDKHSVTTCFINQRWHSLYIKLKFLSQNTPHPPPFDLQQKKEQLIIETSTNTQIDSQDKLCLCLFKY